MYLTLLESRTYDVIEILVSKNDTAVAHYNFNIHQPILVIFGRNIAEIVRYQMVICYPTSPNQCFCTTWGNMNMKAGNRVFSVMLYRPTVSRKRHWFGLLYLQHSSASL